MAEEKKRRVGRLKSFQRELRKPERIALIVEVPEAHDAAGKWTQMRFVVTRTDGDIKEFVVPLDDEHDLDWWHDEFEDLEVDFYAYAAAKGE